MSQAEGDGRELLDVVITSSSPVGLTAPAAGLYLVGVDYPDRFGLDSPPPGPLFLGLEG